MTPATIIRRSQEDGVTLALSAAGTIKATGNGDAVNRWLPVLREHKHGIVAALQEAANDPLPDPTVEARQQRVLAMLAAHPEARYAVLTDSESDTKAVIVVVAIRERATCELHIPRDKYDGTLLLALIERHGATVH